MTVQVTIRNVPENVRDELRMKAAAERKSMQEYLLGELEQLASRPSMAQWLASVRARKVLAPNSFEIESILEARDSDRR